MTTEGEQMEAVCGACGGRIRRVGVGNNPGTLRGALVCENGHAIPTPVVPSDERCSTCDRREREDCPQCEFDIHREAPGIGACQKHHPFSYPPTPSQDAESVRNDSDRQQRSLSQDAEGDGLYRYEESMGARCCITCLALPGEPHADGCHALALVSAIRETYEALVKAEIARKAAERGMDTLDRTQRIIARRLLVDAEADIEAALTRIEESLGGRS